MRSYEDEFEDLADAELLLGPAPGTSSLPDDQDAGEDAPAEDDDDDDDGRVSRGWEQQPAPASEAEIRAWYQYDWAVGAVNMHVIGILMPLLLQAVALDEAGFPDACGNYNTNLSVAPSSSRPSSWLLAVLRRRSRPRDPPVP